MTSQARLTAARIAVRTAARGYAAGNVPAAALASAVSSCLSARAGAERADAARRTRRAIIDAKTLVRKSQTARLLCGAGDLWNGDDRAHQFALLNEAARLRRASTLYWS